MDIESTKRTVMEVSIVLHTSTSTGIIKLFNYKKDHSQMSDVDPRLCFCEPRDRTT